MFACAPGGVERGEGEVHGKSYASNVGVRNLLVGAAFEAFQSFADPESDPGKGSGTTGQLRSELSCCAGNPLPHSIFLGRVPRPGEPLWLPSDRQKALAFERYKSEIHRCGHDIEEWGRSEDELGGAPFETVEANCPACALMDEAERERNKHRDDITPGSYLVWKRTDPVDED